MKRILTVVGLFFLAVAAFFEHLLFWVYVWSGSILLAAIFAHKILASRRQTSQFQYGRVLAVGRLRRFVRQANKKSEGFWQLLPSTRVITCFVGVSVACLLVGAVIGANLVRIRNVGTIRAIGVEVYADAELTTVLHEIAWGTMDPGESRSFTAWIKNTGNDAQKLVMWTEGWVPVSAQNSISLNWDYGNEWIPAGASVPVVFTLSVDSNIADVVNFSFEVVVQGVS